MIASHRLGLRLGVAVVPNNYYSAVPDLNLLERTEKVWAKRSSLIGVDIDLDGQVQRLRDVCLPFQSEYRGNSVYEEACAKDCGPGFGPIEAQALHSVVRYFKPRNIVEVGCGVSTFCILHAASLNKSDGAASKLTCIEPYPRLWLNRAPVELIARPVQEVPFETFTNLGVGDFLFIDSSHAVKTGSDVNFLMLEVWPRLNHGVIVHFHDIYLPFDYSPVVLQVLVQPAETTLLHALLIGNADLRILFSLSLLHYDRTDVLREVFPDYVPRPHHSGLRNEGMSFYGSPGHFPTSIYLRSLSD